MKKLSLILLFVLIAFGPTAWAQSWNNVGTESALRSAIVNGGSSVTKLTWEGDNIVKAELVTLATTLTTDYTYDNKINPLYGLFGQGFYSTPQNFFSANNILTEITEMPIIGVTTSEHTYEYDSDYPVKETVITKTGVISSKIVITYSYK